MKKTIVPCAALICSFTASAMAESETYDPPIPAKKTGGESCYQGDRAPESKPAEPQVIIRYPPRYPDRCMRRAKRVEVITVLYDVGPDGGTCNIRIAATTNSCLNNAAASAVLKWEFEKTERGSFDIKTDIRLELDSR